jgi:hypothetical protein
MAPIITRNNRNVVKSCAKPIAITGIDPSSNNQVYVSRGPMTSHIQPASSRAKIVTATEPMMHQPTCSLVSCNSPRTTAISGAMPNQAKKHKKKAIHDMWNARMFGVERLNSAMRVALPSASMADDLGGEIELWSE